MDAPDDKRGADLFARAADRERRGQPLAERMRPADLDEVVGQGHLVGPRGLLRRLLAAGDLPSLILWGPPGTGKTTLARILARRAGARFTALSAVGAGVKELRAAVAGATRARDQFGRRTVLFIDEIHRFNKAQQDALLPHVERGTVTLVGATTENPSFEVNAALLSRARVLRLEPIGEEDLVALLRRALARDRGLAARGVTAGDEILRGIARIADGDARRALTTLEVAALLVPQGGALGREAVEQAAQRRMLLHDKGAEEHYNVTSAFIKSMRGSDPDAAVYWLARMIEAGEDVLFIARRMVIFAAEDVGNADPRALGLAVAAMEAARFVGLPEATLPLTQAATYLACAPKSNAVIRAYTAARRAVREEGSLPVPLHLRNAPTAMMAAFGYGRGYRYPHDHPGHHVAERYLPDALGGTRFYEPSDQGEERAIAARLARWRGARPAAEGAGGGEEGG